MTTWKQIKKANFKWNQYVKMFVDGEQVTDAMQVRDTDVYDEYEVDEMFGYNGVTKIMLVKSAAEIDLDGTYTNDEYAEQAWEDIREFIAELDAGDEDAKGKLMMLVGFVGAVKEAYDTIER